MRDPLDLLSLFLALFDENPVGGILVAFALIGLPGIIGAFWAALISLFEWTLARFSSQRERRSSARESMRRFVGDVLPFVVVACVWGAAGAVRSYGPPSWAGRTEQFMPTLHWVLLIALGAIVLARFLGEWRRGRQEGRELELEIDDDLERMRSTERDKRLIP